MMSHIWYTLFKDSHMVQMNLHNYLYSVLLISLIYISKANAQTNIGIDAGVTNNSLSFYASNTNLILKSRQGYLTNISINHILNKWLCLEAGPGVIQKNYSITNTTEIYQNINNTYLNFPVSMKVTLKAVNRINFNGSIGGYYSYWIASMINGIAPNVFELSSNSEGFESIKLETIKDDHSFTKQDNRKEWGWVAKLALDYRIVNSIYSSIKLHYYGSLSDQQKLVTGFQTPRYNKTSAISVGIYQIFN